MKPYLNELSEKSRTVINEFKGINTGISPLLIADGQAEDMKNLDTRDYPALITRAPRELIYTATNAVHQLGTIDGTHISAVDGNKWGYLDGAVWNEIGTVGNESGDSVIFRGKCIYVNGSSGGGYCFENGTFSRLNDMRICHYITSNANRLYAVDKNESYLYFSDYGDSGADNWTGEGSGVIDVITPNGEKCSGITSYNGNVIVFKPHSMHELYGTGPSSYQFITVSGSIGCASHRTISEVSRNLFWLGDSVYMYGGGSKPSDIGLPIQKYINNAGDTTKACAGTDGERYYLSIPQANNTYVLLVYDTRTGIWTAEENSGFIQFASVDNTLYGVDSQKRIYKMISDSTESVTWYWHSKWFASGAASMRQNWNSLYITLEKATGATFNVDIINNASQSAAIKTYESSAGGNLRVLRIMLAPSAGHNADRLQIKLSGTGYCKIHSIEKDVRTKRGGY